MMTMTADTAHSRVAASRWARDAIVAFTLCGSLCAASAFELDTGPGSNSGGGWTLYDDRPAGGYQALAAGFTLDAPTRIASVQTWINWAFGGGLAFSVHADFGGLPGAQLYRVETMLQPTVLNVPDWRGVGALQWDLLAGKHWLVFEALGSGGGALPGGAQAPAERYASSPGLLGTTWMAADTLGFGVRINTLPEPPPAIPVVPEPTGAALMLAGLALLAGALRRRTDHRL